MYVDYSKVNKVTIKIYYLLPLLFELLNEFIKANIWTKIDL